MRSADRVKVQIGVSRSQREVVGDSLTRMNCIGTSEGSSNDSGISTKQEEEAAVAAAAFPTSAPLVNLCSSSFLRKKRKLDTIPAKVLTVDSDYKLKRSAASIQAEEQDNGTGNDLISADARYMSLPVSCSRVCAFEIRVMIFLIWYPTCSEPKVRFIV
mmetsp:Transcript_15229/g.25402  ORF Transcript_15229/g.25402 Transcript_15229/m.25402 type:complete len:159 (-) Transcript_15229:906-1382(-)